MTRDLIDNIKPVLRRAPDTIILHCGITRLSKWKKSENCKARIEYHKNCPIGCGGEGWQGRYREESSKIEWQIKNLLQWKWYHCDWPQQHKRWLSCSKRGDSFLTNNFLKFLGEHCIADDSPPNDKILDVQSSIPDNQSGDDSLFYGLKLPSLDPEKDPFTKMKELMVKYPNNPAISYLNKFNKE